MDSSLIINDMSQAVKCSYIKSLIVNPIQYIMTSLTTGLFWKSALSTILWFITYFIYSDVEAFFVLIGFIIIDWITGIWKILKFTPEKFCSSRFRDTAVKALFYIIMLAMTYSLERIASIFLVLHLDAWMLSYLCLTELVSVMENVTTISGIVFPTAFVDYVKKLKDEKPGEKK